MLVTLKSKNILWPSFQMGQWLVSVTAIIFGMETNILFVTVVIEVNDTQGSLWKVMGKNLVEDRGKRGM